MKPYKLGMLLFPGLTLQDFIGPYDVFIRVPCFEVFVVSENTALMEAEGGLQLKASYSFEDCPPVDVVFVPGGQGINALLQHEAYLLFLQRQAAGASYITAVCTGSLLLAAAGLLKGYKATTHWRSLELLQQLGVEVVQERVVHDRNRITGGGVTAGLDFALSLTAGLAGEEMAKTVQLMLEYNPAPPFQAGTPQTAGPAILQLAKARTQAQFERRLKIVQQLTAEAQRNAQAEVHKDKLE